MGGFGEDDGGFGFPGMGGRGRSGGRSGGRGGGRQSNGRGNGGFDPFTMFFQGR